MLYCHQTPFLGVHIGLGMSLVGEYSILYGYELINIL